MEKLQSILLRFKKVILVILPLVMGLLLILAGLNLLQLTPSLTLYLGLVAMILAVLSYFLN